MRIEIGQNSEIIIKQVYNGITLETNSGEKISICMRDNGYEFSYGKKNYSAQNDEIHQVFPQEETEEATAGVLRVVDTLDIPKKIYASQQFTVQITGLIEEGESILLRDRKSIIRVDEITKTGDKILMKAHYVDEEGIFIYSDLLSVGSPLNTGYGI